MREKESIRSDALSGKTSEILVMNDLDLLVEYMLDIAMKANSCKGGLVLCILADSVSVLRFRRVLLVNKSRSS